MVFAPVVVAMFAPTWALLAMTSWELGSQMSMNQTGQQFSFQVTEECSFAGITGVLAELDADVRNHEPHVALDGGAAGTAVIERLIPEAAERLRPGGWLLIEVSPHNAQRVEQLVAAAQELVLNDTIKDLAGHPRVVQAQKE